ncbi:YbaK/EbsC family protein [Actinomyces wuliandei]|uniref:YbaK/EbsC family protein n=1 Tax=Actinomyces wuliandei TaxID=2057743 RepID=UPI000FD8F075|nr:YbaK/EbsC family protein [Actinomyces wuliandei]
MSELRDPEEVFATDPGWLSALERTDLLAGPVAAALRELAASDAGTTSAGSSTGSHPREDEDAGTTRADLARQARVVPIDPALSDTDVLNARYLLDPHATGNCVLVAGKRQGEERAAACVVRATDLADVNHVVKRRLDVRKASFLPMDRATDLSGMAYGGITPVGLPSHWRLLIDAVVASRPTVLIGSGLRGSKLLVPGALLAALPGAEVVEGLGVPTT